jgi:sulfide dehydrogenase cytochrome subunit
MMLLRMVILPKRTSKGPFELRPFFAIFALALMPQVAIAQAALTGKTMADTCSGCHGTDGVPAVSYIPALAGLTVEEFTEAMVAYRDGTRRATIMNRVAPAFTDEEIAAMADYFASLPRPTLAETIRTRPEE